MFLLKFFSLVLSTILLYVIASILFYFIIFIKQLLNCIKKIIVWIFRGQIYGLTLYPAQKRYRQEVVETGFSSTYRHVVSHYRYQTVFDGTYRKIIVYFSKHLWLKLNIREEDALYKKLMSL